MNSENAGVVLSILGALVVLMNANHDPLINMVGANLIGLGVGMNYKRIALAVRRMG